MFPHDNGACVFKREKNIHIHIFYFKIWTLGFFLISSKVEVWYYSIASCNFPISSGQITLFSLLLLFLFCLFFHMSLFLQEGSTHLAELAQQSGSESRILQSPRLRPKPRPPGGCTGPAAQSVALCHRSRILNSGLKSLIFNSSHHLSPGQQVQTSSPSFHPRPQVETPLSPTPFSSERFRYSPIHRRVASSFDTSWENL